MALAIGTNSGFVTTAPSTDPADTDQAADNRAWATRVTSPATAVKITEVGWYCDNATQAANFEVGLYTDDDNPNARLFVEAYNAKGTTSGWKSVAVDWEISPSTTYWIAMQLDNTATTTDIIVNTSGGSGFSYDNGATSLPNPFTESLTDSNGIAAIYAVWEAAPPGPTIEATATSIEGNSVTDHDITYPAGIAANDLLICFFATDGDNVVNWSAGWNSILSYDRGITIHLSVAWKKAVGTESGTFRITTDETEQSAHSMYRITGAMDPTSQPPECSTGADASSTNPNPDSLTPTGGSKDYLWLAACCYDGPNQDLTQPSGYSNLLEANAWGIQLGTSQLWETDSSEDPGVFTSYSDPWIACTVAVHPTGGGGGGTNFQVQVGEAWKDVSAMQIQVGESWKAVASAQEQVGDAWKTIF